MRHRAAVSADVQPKRLKHVRGACTRRDDARGNAYVRFLISRAGVAEGEALNRATGLESQSGPPR